MNEQRSHLPTVIAIAIVVYAVTNMIHEGLGHGGACLLLGGRAKELSSVHFSYYEGSLTAAQSKIVSAAGCVANALAAIAGLLAFRRSRTWAWWLFTAINLMMPAGYLLFSGALKVGDWVNVLRDVRPVMWRPALAIVGAALYVLAVRFSARLLGEPASRLATISYITGGLLYCLSGLFNPHGPMLIAISAAAASFGGTSGLMWFDEFVKDRPVTLVVQRSNAWLAAGVITAVVFIAALGPSLRF